MTTLLSVLTAKQLVKLRALFTLDSRYILQRSHQEIKIRENSRGPLVVDDDGVLFQWDKHVGVPFQCAKQIDVNIARIVGTVKDFGPLFFTRVVTKSNVFCLYKTYLEPTFHTLCQELITAPSGIGEIVLCKPSPFFKYYYYLVATGQIYRRKIRTGVDEVANIANAYDITDHDNLLDTEGRSINLADEALVWTKVA